MQCPFCRAEHAADAKFCRSCGKPLNAAPATTSSDHTLLHTPPTAPDRETCLSCGTLNAPGVRFCRGCGKNLVASVAAADATQLHIPPAPVSVAASTSVDSDATMLHVPPVAQPPLPETPIAEPEATLLHVPAEAPVAQPAEAEATLLAVPPPVAASPVPLPTVAAPEIAPEQTAIPCPVCHTGNTPGARFCRSCGGAMKGAELPPAAVVPEPAPVSRASSAVKPAGRVEFGSVSDFDDDYSAPMQPSRKGLWVGVIAALISLVLAAGGGAAWYFLRAKPASETVTVMPKESAPMPLPVPQSEPVKELPPAPPLPVETQPATSPPVPAAAPVSEMPKPQQAPAADAGARAEPPRVAPENKPKPLPPAQNPPVRGDAAPKMPPQAMPAPPPPVPVAPAVPTWLENMRADLDRCARKGGLSAMWCNEKVRHKHCPGHWNTVKECEVKDATQQPNVGMGG